MMRVLVVLAFVAAPAAAHHTGEPPLSCTTINEGGIEYTFPGDGDDYPDSLPSRVCVYPWERTVGTDRGILGNQTVNPPLWCGMWCIP